MTQAAVASAFTVEPYSWGEAHALAEQLAIPEPVAIALVRRGHRTRADAEEFLSAAAAHDPYEFEGMDAAVGLLARAVGSRRRITIHGDYDVDGVCATTIMVEALRAAGAECDWVIPDRLADGYGLTMGTVRELNARRTELLVTADCGIGCREEVEAATDAGIEVLVTDHHQPPELLPDCTILHPALSGYPCPELCGTGVAFKLAEAFRRGVGRPVSTGNGDALEANDGGLDLVALATVADLVPLRDENRALVRRGLTTLRRAQRPGIRALIAAAGVEPERLDEGDIAFRLAPRINAAGRLYRADAAVELLLTPDAERAEEIAAELNTANRERRSTEIEVMQGAERALRELTDDPSGLPALVLAAQGWHAGVVGIAASRLAERHWRPTVLIGLDGSGGGRGSGRSISGFDLLAGLEACSEHLVRFGGHRAAAGLEIEAGSVEAFRDAFAAHAAAELDAGDLVRTSPVDAVVGSEGLGMELAEQLERLAPFGAGNPGVRLLVPAARVRDVRPMGESKSHARFMIESGTRRALGVAFDINGELREAEQAPHDLGVRLEVNRWNGAEHPRAVLRDIYRVDGGAEASGEADEAAEDTSAEPRPSQASGCEGEASAEPTSEPDAGCPSPAIGEEWWSRFDAEPAADPEAWPPAFPATVQAARRAVVDVHEASTVARMAELVSSGTPVLAVCADAARRRELLAGAANPERFGGAAAALACGRCNEAAREAIAALSGDPGLALCDWAVLGLDPELAGRFPHVVLVDPPPFAHLADLVAGGDGFLHRCWGSEDVELALRVHEIEWDPRPALADVFRMLRAEPGRAAEGDRLMAVLAGSGRYPRSPETAARTVRVLEELALIGRTAPGARKLRVVSSERTELERSAAYAAYRDRHEEGTRFLETMRHPP